MWSFPWYSEVVIYQIYPQLLELGGGVGEACDFNREVSNNFSFACLERLIPEHCNTPGVMVKLPRCQYGTCVRGESGEVREVGITSEELVAFIF